MSCLVKSSIVFCTVTFDANGGSSVQPKRIMMGQQLGTLPSPTKSECNLIGWFTESGGGTQVTSETVVTHNMTLYAQWQDISNPVVNLSASSGQITISASDPQSGIAGYDLKTTNTTPALSDYTSWDGASKSLAVSNDTNEYLWVKNGSDLITKKSFFLHYHTGNSTSGGGCYIKPNYHVHTGNSTSGGGCYGTQKTRQVFEDKIFRFAQLTYGYLFLTNGQSITEVKDQSNYLGMGAGATCWLVNWKLRIYKDSAMSTYYDASDYYYWGKTYSEAYSLYTASYSGLSGTGGEGLFTTSTATLVFASSGLKNVSGNIPFGFPKTETYYDLSCGKTTSTIESYSINCGKNEGLTYI